MSHTYVILYDHCSDVYTTSLLKENGELWEENQKIKKSYETLKENEALMFLLFCCLLEQEGESQVYRMMQHSCRT